MELTVYAMSNTNPKRQRGRALRKTLKTGTRMVSRKGAKLAKERKDESSRKKAQKAQK
ncbi:MAG: hypothetical protein SH850_04135 [Planctomycetaceae bacterium]|nr:hypothetical protein [Planctomycetaceae bacterium]